MHRSVFIPFKFFFQGFSMVFQIELNKREITWIRTGKRQTKTGNSMKKIVGCRLINKCECEMWINTNIYNKTIYLTLFKIMATMLQCYIAKAAIYWLPFSAVNSFKTIIIPFTIYTNTPSKKPKIRPNFVLSEATSFKCISQWITCHTRCR